MTPTTFSTASLPPAQQLEYWRDAICSVFMPLEVDLPHDGHQGFQGRIVQHSQGNLDLAEVMVEGHAVLRTPRQISHNGEDSFLVLVQRSGETWIEQEGRSGWLRRGEFVLLDSARVYTMRFPDPVHHEILRVPGQVVRGAVRRSERFTAVPMSGTSGVGRILVSMLDSVRDTASELAQPSAAGVSDALVDLLGASISTIPSAHEHLPTNLELYHRERVRLLVRQRLFESDLSVESVAAEVKLSPRYVHRLFEGGPLTLSAWIWHERLEAARRALLSPTSAGRSLTDIAYSVGFKDPAHFSRLFKSTYGKSPRSFRAELGQRA